MILNHFHIHEASSSIVSQSHSITCHNQCVSAWFEHSTTATSRENYCFCAYCEYLATTYFKSHYPCDNSIFNYQRSYKPFFITSHTRFKQLLKHHMQQSLSSEVSHKKGSLPPLPSKSSSPQSSFFISRKSYSEMFHVYKRLTCCSTHHFYSILIT